MNRQQLLQQMTCLGLTALLLIGCGGTQVEPTATPMPLLATQTPTVRSHVPPAPAPVSLVSTPLARLDGKRALFVIYNRFEEDEYGIPRAILEQLGVAVTVASSSLEIRTGTRGAKVQPDLLVERDDLIITADGPGRSREFGETIAAAMGE